MTSSSQSEASALLRGNDFSTEETDKALAHKREQEQISKTRATMAAALKGDPARYRELLKKTLPLADSSPSYEDGYP